MSWNTTGCNSPNLSISVEYRICSECGKSYKYEGKKIVCLCTGKQTIVEQAPEQWNLLQECDHKGHLVGKVHCHCATTKAVYECKVHQYCTPRPTTYKEILTLEGEVLSVTPKGCSKCQEKVCGQSNQV